MKKASMLVIALAIHMLGCWWQPAGARDAELPAGDLADPGVYCESYQEGTAGSSRYSKIATISGSCSNQGGALSLSASLYTQGGTTDSVRLVATLQRSTASGWNNVDSWVTTGTTQAVWVQSYPGITSQIYRLRVYGIASNSKTKTSESDILYTNPVVCQK